jgi:hypothetical protein
MHAEINVRFELSIDDDKTIPLAVLAEFVTDQNVESVLLEELVESLDASRVEALCGEKYAHGNGDQRFQRRGTDPRTAVTTAGEHEFDLHYVEDTAADYDEPSYLRPVEDVIDFDGQNRYQQDIAAKSVDLATSLSYRDAVDHGDGFVSMPSPDTIKELPDKDEDTEFDRIGRKVNIRANGEGRRAAINNAMDFLGANIPTYFVDLPHPSSDKVDPDDVVLGDWGHFDTVLASAKPASHNPEYQKRAAEVTAAKSHSWTGGSAGAESDVRGPSGDYPSDGQGSALYDTILTDLDTVGLRAGDRGVNPFGDHGNSGGYFEVYNAGETGYDYKYKTTYNGLNGILVEADERDAANAEGGLSFREHLAAWDHAKGRGYIPDDDPIPLKALWQVVVASDENRFGAEDWVWRARLSSETDVEELENEDVWPGKIVGESDERKQEIAERLPDGVYPGFGTPKGAYNTGLEILDEREVEHGREKVPTGDFAPTWDDVPCYNENGKLLKGKTRRRAAGLLRRREEFVTPTPQGAELGKTPLYHYDENTGSFGRTGTAWVNQRIGQKVPILGSADTKEVVSLIKRQTYIDRDSFDAGEYDDALVNLKNGVYNLKTGELEDHSPEYRFRTSIPQKNARTPNARISSGLSRISYRTNRNAGRCTNGLGSVSKQATRSIASSFFTGTAGTGRASTSDCCGNSSVRTT